MIQSIVLPLILATQISQEIHAILALTSQPSLSLAAKINTIVVRFLSQSITPAATFDFEKELRLLLDECGRQVVQAVYNHIEPSDPQDLPKHTQRDRQDYVRKNHKSLTRGGIATLFGKIELERCLYEPLQEARDDDQPSFAPLELSLGIVAHNATPALAERVGRLANKYTQQELLDHLESAHHVCWSVQVLRKVAADVSAGIAPYLRETQRQTVLGWLIQAQQSRGRHRVVLSVGRDGIMLPIRNEEGYKEGSVATISVYDRRGRRLGTLYLGEMPEAKQVTLSGELTALLHSVLAAYEGPLPRLVYLTDAGYNQMAYFEEVLKKMKNPRQADKRLQWTWIVDYFHAASYISKLAQVLFADVKTQQAWAKRMRQLLRDEERGVYRVLQSAAQYHGRKVLSKKKEKEYQGAYNYLLKYSEKMNYSVYKRAHLPIGSGVTEAGCKVVFTQRFKESGMKWSLEGGEVILRLRLAVLSGVWDDVYKAFLNSRHSIQQAS